MERMGSLFQKKTIAKFATLCCISPTGKVWVLTLSILHIPMALWLQSSGHLSLLKWHFLAWFIPNIPIALRFKISGHHSPLEWYLNGVETQVLLILNIPMALWFQNSGHHSPLEWYFNWVRTLASLILHIAIALSVKNSKIPAPKAHWNDISIRSKRWYC